MIASFRSEWMKLRRSSAVWLVLLSSCFVPSIILAARLTRPASLPSIYRAPNFWESLWKMSWEAVAILLLPMVVMLITSLVVQLETRNNTWKQLHASPQRLISIFTAKLLVILALLACFFLFANLAIYCSAMIPALIFHDVRRPAAPVQLFAARSVKLFLDGLPIVALQYLLSLRVKNFMVPLGIGMGLWLAAIGGLSWKYIYLIPYGYTAMDFLSMSGARSFSASIHLLSLAFFIGISLLSVVMYLRQDDRG
jgi:lantibiotic transport system permease protein